MATVFDISSSRNGNGATADVDVMPSSLSFAQRNTDSLQENATTNDVTTHSSTDTLPTSILRNTTAANKNKEVVSWRRRVEWNLHQNKVYAIPTRAMMLAEAQESADIAATAAAAAVGVGVGVGVDANASQIQPTFDIELACPRKRNLAHLSGDCVHTKKTRIVFDPIVTPIATAAAVGVGVDASRIQLTDIDRAHTRRLKRKAPHLSVGELVLAKKMKKMAVDSNHITTTSTLLPQPPILRNPPASFHNMKSNYSPFQAAEECSTGVLHLSSSNSMQHYHMWVTDNSLVPMAKQYFAGKGFNNITFVAFGDRKKYMSLYSKTAPLYPDALVNNKLFESMELDPNAGMNFHPGVFSPKKKRTHGRSHRRHKLNVTHPIFFCNGDDAASAVMVASGEGGRMGRSLEERVEVTDISPPTIPSAPSTFNSHGARSDGSDVHSTKEIDGKKGCLNPTIPLNTPPHSPLFAADSLAEHFLFERPRDEEKEEAAICGEEDEMENNDSAIAPVVGEREAPPAEAPVDGKAVDGVEQGDDEGDEEKVDVGNALATGNRDQDVETVGEHVFFEGPNDLGIDTAIAVEAAASGVGEAEAPHVEAHGDGEEVTAPIAIDDEVEAAELGHALQQLELANAEEVVEVDDVPYAMENEAEVEAVVNALQQLGGERTWRASYDLLCEFKVGNGHCNVPREYPPDPKLGRWVNKVSSNDQLLDSYMVPYCI